MRLLGFEIKRNQDEKSSGNVQEIATPITYDGGIEVGALGDAYNMFYDMGGSFNDEAALITKYRSMAIQNEINMAVDDIVNEAISVDDTEEIITLNLDEVDLSDNTKKKIQEEFDHILSLLDFSNNAYELFYKWYVDGRINFHLMFDKDDIKAGIKELRYLDPRKIKLIREVEEKRIEGSNDTFKKVKSEYYAYSESGFGRGNTSSVKVSKDSIVRTTSGILNETNTMALSYLHKAIKPYNQLMILEDATVIYTMTRAPERRVFYVDVGNLPKGKAEQYLRDQMNRHKQKVQYNATTGEIDNSRRAMSMTEDFWFPRREGSRGTEIDTLPSGGQLMNNENLTYFLRKLYKSLSVPISRMEPENMYAFGRVSEISRDEVKFSNFIRRLRSRFANVFDELLERQLIMKNIIAPEDWDAIKYNIKYRFRKSNQFEELKNQEILRERVSLMRDFADLEGMYYSKLWVRKNILRMTDEEIEEEDKQIEEERKNNPDQDDENLGGL